MKGQFLNKNAKIFLTAILLFTCSITFLNARKSKSHLIKEEEFPELRIEEIIRAKQKYAEEEDIDQKGFLEPIVNPEKFDLNMDEMISKSELKKAIIWCIYSKDPKNKKKMKEIMTDHVKNMVEVYVNSLDFESFNYLQFGKFMNRISANEFINEEIMISRHWVDGGEHREPAIDL